MGVIAESAAMLSQDAKGKGEETFPFDQLSILFCGWRDAVYARGETIFILLHVARAAGDLFWISICTFSSYLLF